MPRFAQDEHCLVLWQLHFISVELIRLQKVAGSELEGRIRGLAVQLALGELFKECQLQVSEGSIFRGGEVLWSSVAGVIAPALQNQG